RAKKPWALSGAAAMLLGTSVLAFGYSQQFRAVASAGVLDAMKRCNDTKTTADRNKSNVDGVLAKIETDKKAVKSVVVGQDERLDWILFNQFVNNALPRPDASNLSADAKKHFWNQSAKDAFQNYRLLNIDRLKPGETTLDEEEWRGDLLQANIESMYCVYCLDLGQFATKLHSDTDVKVETMRAADWAKAPEGKGWIAEVHGYTYFHDGLKFIHEALVENLASMPLKPELASADAAGAGGAPGAATAPAGTGAPEGASGKAEHPIWNRVSHVVIYNYFPDANPDPGTQSFKLIGQRVIDSLLGGGAGPGGPMGGKMGMMGMGPPGGGGAEGAAAPAAMTNSWSPLGSGGGSSGPGRSGPGGMSGMPNMASGGGGGGGNMQDMMRNRKGPPDIGGMAGMRGGKLGATGAGAGRPDGGIQLEKTGSKSKAHLTRTEFVILFIWREPTPSDLLLPEETGAADIPQAR
ncbi:MAG TPA: hypothetical protein VGP68_05820, partial [Gemmataceae bacterium]|nr:hypothetical protein [Gemmataceae bacterium]